MSASLNIRPRALLALLLAALALGAALPALASAAAAKRVAAAPGAVRDYWTAARMRAAEPADAGAAPTEAARAEAGSGSSPRAAAYVPAASAGEPAAAPIERGSPPSRSRILGPTVRRDEIADPAAPATSAHGKVFLTVPTGSAAGDYVCSGTALNSRNRSVVWTAGHCVFDDAGGGFATNWMFVPGYKDGVAPYGEWPARRLATTKGWRTAANLRFDLGAAVVRRNASGRRLTGVVGGRGVGFDQPRDHLYQAFGYPAEPPPLEFTGEREFRCTSDSAGTDQPLGDGPSTMAINCDMTAGSSGGGWIDAATLLSVTSYGYGFDPGRLYGPYMSTSAKSLYKSVRGKRKRKRGGRGAKGSGKRSRGGAGGR